MTRIDEELGRRFDAALQPVEAPSAAPIERRRARAASLRRAGRIVASTTAVLVIVASVVWARTLIGNDTVSGAKPASPYPIVPATNGLIAVADGASLWTIDPTTGDLRTVPNGPDAPWHPAWSPDGSQIAVSAFPSMAARELWVGSAEGSDGRVVATATNIGPPSWSPDGSSIAYTADTTQGSSVHVLSLATGEDRVVGDVIEGAAVNYFSVAFSPDGTELLFDKGTDSGYGIFVMDVNGSDVRKVSEGSGDYNPAWSPDGTSIAFTRQEAATESDIFVMNADGSGVRRVTDGGPGATNLDPTWSPDGRLIAYIAGKSGGPGGLVLVRPDGSSPQTLNIADLVGIGWQPIR